MQAIREIREVFSEELVLHLPAEFLQQTVEIIVLPLGEYALQTPPGRHKSLHDFFGILPDFPERAEQGQYEKRDVL